MFAPLITLSLMLFITKRRKFHCPNAETRWGRTIGHLNSAPRKNERQRWSVLFSAKKLIKNGVKKIYFFNKTSLTVLVCARPPRLSQKTSNFYKKLPARHFCQNWSFWPILTKNWRQKNLKNPELFVVSKTQKKHQKTRHHLSPLPMRVFWPFVPRTLGNWPFLAKMTKTWLPAMVL